MSSAVAAVARPSPSPTRRTALCSGRSGLPLAAPRVHCRADPVRARQVRRVLTDDWARYLAPQFNGILPGSAQDAMYLVGDIALRDFGLMLGALTLALLAGANFTERFARGE
jgi:hypothetical protein